MALVGLTDHSQSDTLALLYRGTSLIRNSLPPPQDH